MMSCSPKRLCTIDLHGERDVCLSVDTFLSITAPGDDDDDDDDDMMMMINLLQ